MVGQEDKGKPLTEWSALLADSAAPLFLHAGETAVVGGAAGLDEGFLQFSLPHSRLYGESL